MILLIETIRSLVAIPSVTDAAPEPGKPYGPYVYEALETALAFCEELGFRTKLDDEGYYGYVEIGAGEELMGILVHLDVVPPGSGWTHDPYGCEIQDGKLFGRGVVDDKGPAVAVMYAMKDILDSELVLDKRVRLILASQEEDGPWADIARYKAQEEIPGFGFTPDASFPATFGEKGILAVALSMPAERAGFREIQGGTATNMVADQAQAVLMDGTVLETRGRSAHGSMPELGDNAITSLMAQAAAHDCPFAQFYMDHIGHALNGEGLGIALEDRASGGLTLNVGKIELAEGKVTMHLDIRYPVTFSPQDVLAPLEGVCAAHGLSLVKEDWMAPVYMDANGPVISALMAAYREVTASDMPPTVMGGGSYARAMEHIVAFGPVFPWRESTEHVADEYIYVEDLEKIREIYRLAIEKLACHRTIIKKG